MLYRGDANSLCINQFEVYANEPIWKFVDKLDTLY